MRTEVAAMAVVVALIIGAGIGYSGIAGNALTRTERITSNSTFTAVVTSHENATRTITSMATSVSYSTITASTTQRVFTTVTRTVANTTLNWDGLIYLSKRPRMLLEPGQPISVFSMLELFLD